MLGFIEHIDGRQWQVHNNSTDFSRNQCLSMSVVTKSGLIELNNFLNNALFFLKSIGTQPIYFPNIFQWVTCHLYFPIFIHWYSNVTAKILVLKYTVCSLFALHLQHQFYTVFVTWYQWSYVLYLVTNTIFDPITRCRIIFVIYSSLYHLSFLLLKTTMQNIFHIQYLLKLFLLTGFYNVW